MESISKKESSTPRTILGFLLGMYGVLVAASVTTILGLAASDSSGAIPYVLAFIALITIALGVSVIAIAWKDPSRLMLGQVTASEYANIRQLHLGDDKRGERAVSVVGSTLLGEKSASDEDSSASHVEVIPQVLAAPSEDQEDGSAEDGRS
jgi:hypothetical protein